MKTRFLVLLMAVTGYAQDNVELNAQIRYRYESVQQNFDQDIRANTYNLLRSRVGVLYKPDNLVAAYFQIQDARILGEENNTLDGSADRLDMHQAYLKIQNPFELPLDMKLGRFEVKYGNERLIGAVGWSNTGRSFNGLSIQYVAGANSFDVFGYKISENLQSGDTGDENFYGAWAAIKMAEQLRTDYFILWRTQFGNNRLSELTLGSNLKVHFGSLHTEIELAYQTGQINSIQDISAYLFALMVSYRLSDAPSQPTVSAGFEFLSGDDDPSNDEYNVFNTLFATNHKYYGIMDFFLNIPRDTDGYGLIDCYLGFSVQMTEDITGVIRAHRFYSGKKYIFQDNNTGSLFGDEIDIIISYQFHSRLKLQAGGGLFFPGEIFKVTRGDDYNTFLYTSIQANL